MTVVVEREVLGEREVEDEPAGMAVLGDVPDPGVVGHLAGRRVLELTPGDDHPPRGSVAEPGECVDQLGLAVVVDPGDPDDLAGANLEGDASDLLDPAVVEHVEVLDLEQRLAGRRSRPSRPGRRPRGRPSAAQARPRSRPRAARCRSSCRGVGR